MLEDPPCSIYTVPLQYTGILDPSQPREINIIHGLDKLMRLVEVKLSRTRYQIANKLFVSRFQSQDPCTVTGKSSKMFSAYRLLLNFRVCLGGEHMWLFPPVSLADLTF